MPYKDLERKRQWEQEHREQRNAKRRAQRAVAETIPSIARSVPDPASGQKSQRGWKTLLGFAVGLGVVLLAVAGMNLPESGNLSTSPSRNLR